MVAFETEVDADSAEEAQELAEQEAQESNHDDWYHLLHEFRRKDFCETYIEEL